MAEQPATQHELPTVKLEDVRTRLKDVSDKISAQVRTLGLGVIAFTWGLLVGDAPVAKNLAASFRWQILAIGGLAILSLLLDFLQYVAGYKNALALFTHMESAGDMEGQYDYSSFSYRVQNFCFSAKQAVLLVATGWLLLRIALQLRAK